MVDAVIQPRVITVGSGAHCDVIIQDDGTVLPEHIRLEQDDAGLWWATAVDMAYKNQIMCIMAHGISTPVRMARVQLVHVDLLIIGEGTYLKWQSIVYGPELVLVQTEPFERRLQH